MRRRVLWGLLLAGVAALSIGAQGPFSAQIQRAIVALKAGDNTWAGTNTFTGSVVGISTLSPTAAEAITGVWEFANGINFGADSDVPLRREYDPQVAGQSYPGNFVQTQKNFSLQDGSNPVGLRVNRLFTSDQVFERFAVYYQGDGYGCNGTDPSGNASWCVAFQSKGGGTTQRDVQFVQDRSNGYMAFTHGAVASLVLQAIGPTVKGSGANGGGLHFESGTGIFGGTPRSVLFSPADGVFLMVTDAGTSFGRLQLGGTTSSFPALKRNGTALESRLADDSAYAPIGGSQVNLGANLALSATAPTISSGFGTSPSVTAGTAAAFRVNVGTGGTASTGVVALPTAATGWNCTAADVTTPDSFVTAQTASTTTTASFKNYARDTGAAIAWTASDILAISCIAF